MYAETSGTSATAVIIIGPTATTYIGQLFERQMYGDPYAMDAWRRSVIRQQAEENDLELRLWRKPVRWVRSWSTWRRSTSHSYPPALFEAASLPVLVHEPVSLRLRRPWMLRLHGGPHERSSRRRRRRTWERSAE
jgi:hypothetical protein